MPIIEYPATPTKTDSYAISISTSQGTCFMYGDDSTDLIELVLSNGGTPLNFFINYNGEWSINNTFISPVFMGKKGLNQRA